MASSKIQKASIHNLMFRAMVSAMTKFPLSSALAGSELVHMAIGNESLLAHGGTLVRSRASVRAQGSFDWISVDVRLLGPFAELVQSQVSIEVDEMGKQIRFTAGERELTVPYSSGSPYAKVQGTREPMSAAILKSDAEKIGYLADVASDDESRPDLNCVAVALVEGKMSGIAANQRSVAVVSLDGFTGAGFIPLHVARVLKEKDSVGQVMSSGAPAALLLKSEVGIHVAPLIDRNQDFPLAQSSQFVSGEHRLIGTVDGNDFVEAFANCRDCLGFISKTGAYVVLKFSGNTLLLHAQSGGGAKFKTSIAAESKKETEIFLPLDEVIKASHLFSGKKMTFGLGKVNSEIFMQSSDVTVVVAPWK